jgi:hypothetical protein
MGYLKYTLTFILFSLYTLFMRQLSNGTIGRYLWLSVIAALAILCFSLGESMRKKMQDRSQS